MDKIILLTALTGDTHTVVLEEAQHATTSKSANYGIWHRLSQNVTHEQPCMHLLLHYFIQLLCTVLGFLYTRYVLIMSPERPISILLYARSFQWVRALT